MSFRKISFSLLLILSISTSVIAVTPGDVTLPSVCKIQEEQLVLNGWGIRSKYCFDLYVGGLYLKNKCNDGNKIINSDEPMAVKIEVISDLITSSRLEEGMRSEFERITEGNMNPYQDRLETLVKAFKEDVKPGDTFDIIYKPGNGTSIYKNNQLQSRIQGHDFKKILFTSWIGDDPADNNLKKGMLGKYTKKKRP